MIRFLIENLLLFLLPTVTYVSFSFLTRRDGATFAGVLNRAPIVTLSILGASLVAIVLSLFGHAGAGKPGQAYEPAVFKDGQVIPGRMK